MGTVLFSANETGQDNLGTPYKYLIAIVNKRNKNYSWPESQEELQSIIPII
jgi:hypothetical protein